VVNSNPPIEVIWSKNNPERDKRIATFCPKWPCCIILKVKIDSHDMTSNRILLDVQKD